MTLQQTLARAAAAGGTKGVTYVSGGASPETHVPYAALLRQAHAVADWLRSEQVRPGQCVILAMATNENFTRAFFGCLLAGAIPVPVAPAGGGAASRSARERLSTVSRLLGRCPLVCDTDAPAGNVGALRLPANLPPPESPLVIDAKPEDTAFLQFSSGSTGAPKGIVIAHENVLANLCASDRGLRKQPEDVMAGWTPLHHDLGLVGFLLGSIHRPNRLVLIETAAFVRRPLLWLDVLEKHRATITAAPNFGQALTLSRLTGAARRDLSSVRLVVNGAEPISPAVMEAFLAACEPHGLRREAMFPVYGLAEATLAVTFPALGGLPRVECFDRLQLRVGDRATPAGVSDSRGMRVVAEGRPLDGCEVRIAGDDDGPLDDGCVGHVQVRGASVTRGYYNDPDATRAAFAGDWLRTGDLGFFRDGDLFITGRAKDVLFVNGQNLYATDIEAVALEAEGMAGRLVAATACRSPEDSSDGLLLFVSAAGGRGDDAVLTAATQHLQTALGLTPDAVVPLPRPQFPRTTSGKLQRHRLRERYEAGEFAAAVPRFRTTPGERAADGPRTPEERVAHGIWARELGLKPESFGIHERFDRLGGKSLNAAAILAALEHHYGGPIPADLIHRCPTVAAVAAHFAGGAGKLRLPNARQTIYRG
jgi:acyl-CoA synthetase (AMP-forming)/AMP-acid ligase II/acyl carrier protein